MRYASLIIGISLPFLGAAQSGIFDDERTLYRKEISGGFIAHGLGWGANFHYGKYTTARMRRLFAFEVVNMKHPKEVKSFNPFYEDSRGYFYGKVNSVLLLRPTIGQRYQITDKIRHGGVEVNAVWGLGPSIALLKPVYLEIGYNDTILGGYPYDQIITEKYDPDRHYADNIYGRSSWFKGLGESQFEIGVFARAGLNFEHSGTNGGLKAIEVGMMADLFARPLLIMAEQEGVENQRFFFGFYGSLHFGKKYVR